MVHSSSRAPSSCHPEVWVQEVQAEQQEKG
jgi:hypothetical protein